MGAYYLHPQTHVPYFYKVIYHVMARALQLGAHNVLGGAQTEKLAIKNGTVEKQAWRPFLQLNFCFDALNGFEKKYATLRQLVSRICNRTINPG